MSSVPHESVVCCSNNGTIAILRIFSSTLILFTAITSGCISNGDNSIVTTSASKEELCLKDSANCPSTNARINQLEDSQLLAASEREDHSIEAENLFLLGTIVLDRKPRPKHQALVPRTLDVVDSLIVESLMKNGVDCADEDLASLAHRFLLLASTFRPEAKSYLKTFWAHRHSNCGDLAKIAIAFMDSDVDTLRSFAKHPSIMVRSMALAGQVVESDVELPLSDETSSISSQGFSSGLLELPTPLDELSREKLWNIVKDDNQPSAIRGLSIVAYTTDLDANAENYRQLVSFIKDPNLGGSSFYAFYLMRTRITFAPLWIRSDGKFVDITKMAVNAHGSDVRLRVISCIAAMEGDGILHRESLFIVAMDPKESLAVRLAAVEAFGPICKDVDNVIIPLSDLAKKADRIEVRKAANALLNRLIFDSNDN